jgi:hypothetical protein
MRAIKYDPQGISNRNKVPCENILAETLFFLVIPEGTLEEPYF